MYDLERFILRDILFDETALDKIESAFIDLSGEEVEIKYKVREDDKQYSLGINNKIINDLSYTYKLYVATEMTRMGYVLIEIDNGYIVHNIKEDSSYAVTNNSCACPSFIYKRSKCKHLIFKEFWIEQRALVNYIKTING